MAKKIAVKVREAAEEVRVEQAGQPGATVQDDSREKKLRELFGLEKPEGSGRGGMDAELVLNDVRIPFELKSATSATVTTARDVGLDHLEKWRSKHWLIGFFNRAGTTMSRAIYASPKDIEPWISKIESYVKPDFDFATLPQRVSRKLLEEILVTNLGDKAVYTLEEARRFHKKQFSAQRYRELMDTDLPAPPFPQPMREERGYTKSRMIEIVALRWKYLTERGSTLNNPHIAPTYHASFLTLNAGTPTEARASLREAVLKALKP